MVLIKVQLCLESSEIFDDEFGRTSAHRLDEDGTPSDLVVPWPDGVVVDADADGADG